MSKTSPAILFLLFNRPDLALRVFERIREVRPSKLFIAVDGPRDAHKGEEKLCLESQAIVKNIDWECEVHTLFRTENLGCRKAVSEAITWFFSHVDEGIILEDDCIPSISFFRFCEELLERYRNNQTIMAISGINLQEGRWHGDADYYFSIYAHCWGWATWKSSWMHYDSEMTQFSKIQSYDFFRTILGEEVGSFWHKTYQKVQNRTINSWAYIWLFSIWKKNGLAIIPNINLVENIGFDERATHTNQKKQHNNIQTYELRHQLRHPSIIVRNLSADKWTDVRHFGSRKASYILRVYYKIISTINLIKHQGK